jgi:hypothetical protein
MVVCVGELRAESLCTDPPQPLSRATVLAKRRKVATAHAQKAAAAAARRLARQTSPGPATGPPKLQRKGKSKTRAAPASTSAVHPEGLDEGSLGAESTIADSTQGALDLLPRASPEPSKSPTGLGPRKASLTGVQALNLSSPILSQSKSRSPAPLSASPVPPGPTHPESSPAAALARKLEMRGRSSAATSPTKPSTSPRSGEFAKRGFAALAADTDSDQDAEGSDDESMMPTAGPSSITAARARAPGGAASTHGNGIGSSPLPIRPVSAGWPNWPPPALGLSPSKSVSGAPFTPATESPPELAPGEATPYVPSATRAHKHAKDVGREFVRDLPAVDVPGAEGGEGGAQEGSTPPPAEEVTLPLPVDMEHEPRTPEEENSDTEREEEIRSETRAHRHAKRSFEDLNVPPLDIQMNLEDEGSPAVPAPAPDVDSPDVEPEADLEPQVGEQQLVDEDADTEGANDEAPVDEPASFPSAPLTPVADTMPFEPVEPVEPVTGAMTEDQAVAPPELPVSREHAIVTTMQEAPTAPVTPGELADDEASTTEGGIPSAFATAGGTAAPSGVPSVDGDAPADVELEALPLGNHHDQTDHSNRQTTVEEEMAMLDQDMLALAAETSALLEGPAPEGEVMDINIESGAGLVDYDSEGPFSSPPRPDSTSEAVESTAEPLQGIMHEGLADLSAALAAGTDPADATNAAAQAILQEAAEAIARGEFPIDLEELTGPTAGEILRGVVEEAPTSDDLTTFAHQPTEVRLDAVVEVDVPGEEVVTGVVEDALEPELVY